LPGGKTTTLNVALPKQKLAVNAVPWAEVTLDQQRVGETPLGAVDVTIGPHVLVFHHPDLGDKTVRVMVRADEAARVSVDMRR
jgi:serine/threonine-protein kinase